MASFNGKFASARQDWETPQWLFGLLDSEFRFQFDLAASPENAKCKQFFSINDDALSQHWHGTCFLNPPYGGTYGKLSNWVKKAYESSLVATCIVCMLIPARTNTAWFRKYCMNATELRFLNGRPRFGGAIHGLPQPLVVVVFAEEAESPRLSSIQVPKLREQIPG